MNSGLGSGRIEDISYSNSPNLLLISCPKSENSFDTDSSLILFNNNTKDSLKNSFSSSIPEYLEIQP